jgi:hypothetical protein
MSYSSSKILLQSAISFGKDAMAQKRAIEEPDKIGAPKISYLEEILSVVPPGEI